MDDFIAARKTMILVSNGRGGFPHPMPMWFYMDGQRNFWCTTFRKSQKVLNLQRDGHASLLFESGETYAELRGLVVQADAEIVFDRVQVAAAMAHIQVHPRELPGSELEKLRQQLLSRAEKRVALRFDPQSWMSWNHTKLGGLY